jgi:hypothetical protein
LRFPSVFERTFGRRVAERVAAASRKERVERSRRASKKYEVSTADAPRKRRRGNLSAFFYFLRGAVCVLKTKRSCVVRETTGTVEAGKTFESSGRLNWLNRLSWLNRLKQLKRLKRLKRLKVPRGVG